MPPFRNFKEGSDLLASARKALDWQNLGFEYTKTDYRFSAVYENGSWSEGELLTSEMIQIHEGAPALHYAQQCFEGLKAQTAKDGRVLLFRPELNAQRMQNTAERLSMPAVPEELFIKGVMQAVSANQAWIPPYGSGASLYIRPLLIGVGENMGLKPAKRYEFRVIVSPVGPYYKSGGLSLISLAVSDFDRAAPHGTGDIKAGANYPGGLYATRKAKELGANEALYLDAAEHRYLEEAGSANILVSMAGNKLVTPKSAAILPSVTRRSIMTIAAEDLGMETEERAIDLRKEVGSFEEVAACGTAAVLSPVGKIWFDDHWHHFYANGEEVGPIMQKLYDLLCQLQSGEREDKYGWTREVAL
ncbi:MAG: branched chain amino acid aminotransferase [Gammaproteobacteria bacterium]|nr:branched chain amino acid aminotransferase [Gammaproteobacteria bacterium]MAY01456.1 branched chain amino acid aminotransferase [Gammaproteobacteria bacterium]|tara:strand:+ start:149372 stop:150451 length:1080 start_codon:yes stop_codon:yes gene_type:complete